MNNSIEYDRLWMRIRDMEIDDVDLTLPFMSRLARENDWEAEYTNRVFEEYKRFLYLAASQEKPVTPSDQVDQAWHLHLVYSRHYWEVLCGDILGKPLHHGPTEGGETEYAKFYEWYKNTLALYEYVFGSKPPEDIWPSPNERFRDVEAFRRVNTARNLILDTGLFSFLFAVFGIMLILFAIFLKESNFVVGLLGAGFIGMAFYMSQKSSKDDENGGGGGGGCGGCGGCGG